jgi:hypothetical protein
MVFDINASTIGNLILFLLTSMVANLSTLVAMIFQVTTVLSLLLH